jgi:hypothetical protein
MGHLEKEEGFELTSPRSARIVSDGKTRVALPEPAEFRHGFRHALPAISPLETIMRVISDSPLSTHCRHCVEPPADIETNWNCPSDYSNGENQLAKGTAHKTALQICRLGIS